MYCNVPQPIHVLVSSEHNDFIHYNYEGVYKKGKIGSHFTSEYFSNQLRGHWRYKILSARKYKQITF